MKRARRRFGAMAARLRRIVIAAVTLISFGAEATSETPFIVRGDPDPNNKLVVGIYFAYATGAPEICTGVAIAPFLVLTAGHCACGIPATYIVSGLDKMTLDVFRGRILKLRADLARGLDGQRFPGDAHSSSIVDAPISFDVNQCAKGYQPGSDLALLVTDLSFCGFGYGCAIGFDKSYWDLHDRLAPGAMMKVSGYGRTETNTMGERKSGMIPVLTRNCLIARYGQNCAPFKEMILSDRGKGALAKDTCGGDSGGPVFLPDGDKWLLVAITSRGTPGLMPGAGACGGGGIYELLGRTTVQVWLAGGIAHVVALQTKHASDEAAAKRVRAANADAIQSPFGDLDNAQAQFDPSGR